jgi:hypothetical protein
MGWSMPGKCPWGVPMRPHAGGNAGARRTAAQSSRGGGGDGAAPIQRALLMPAVGPRSDLGAPFSPACDQAGSSRKRCLP